MQKALLSLLVNKIHRAEMQEGKTIRLVFMKNNSPVHQLNRAIILSGVGMLNRNILGANQGFE